MNVDEDRENVFQILAARTTGTEDEVSEFAQAIEEKYAADSVHVNNAAESSK